MGLLKESDLSKLLRKQGRMLCINLSTDIVDSQAANRLGEALSRKFGAVVVNNIAGVSTVAMEDPADLYFVDEIAARLKNEILPVHANPRKLANAWMISTARIMAPGMHSRSLPILSIRTAIAFHSLNGLNRMTPGMTHLTGRL